MKALPKKTLVIFAHPNPRHSRANTTILHSLAKMENVTISDLYEKYPNFFIDVRAEQELLASHELIMFQHPVYWYSMPSLLKEWFDSVLEVGFAYGPGGTVLRDKGFFLSVTAGGAWEDKQQNSFNVNDILQPYKQTAKLCGMNWYEPAVLHNAIHATHDEIKQHAKKVAEKLGYYCESDYQHNAEV